MENRTALSKRIEEGMRRLFGLLVFDTVIHKSVALAEAPSKGQSILTFAPDSKGAKEYAALAHETLARLSPVQTTAAETQKLALPQHGQDAHATRSVSGGTTSELGRCYRYARYDRGT
jgi:nitrogenase subunit NifH